MGQNTEQGSLAHVELKLAALTHSGACTELTRPALPLSKAMVSGPVKGLCEASSGSRFWGL